MARKRFTTEQIIGLLREAEVRLSQGSGYRHGVSKHRCLAATLLSLATRIRWPQARPGQALQGSRTRERAAEEGRVRVDVGQADPEGSSRGKVLSPSEMLVAEGWRVNIKRVYRIWRREGLKIPMKRPKRGRLWLNDGSCVRLRPERLNHVWSYDFVQDRTHDGRAFRMLVVLDEFTRRCLAIVVARRPRSDDVLHCLADLMVATDRLSTFAPTTAQSLSISMCTARGGSADRELAETLQRRQAALLSQLSAVGARSDLAASIRSATRADHGRVLT